MKKLLVCLVVLAFLLVPAMAMAKNYNPGVGLPEGAEEVPHWELGANEWTGGAGITGSGLARCWRSGGDFGYCNKEYWKLDVVNHASVAQWCNWLTTGTRWDWRVLKPGTYAADCITFWVQSNNDVLIDYDGFADLQYQEEGGELTIIPVWYAYGETLPEPNDARWIRAADLNTHDDLILDSRILHDAGLSYKLWNKIKVVNCNSSCEYEDEATIGIVIMNLKHWVDGADGSWQIPGKLDPQGSQV